MPEKKKVKIESLFIDRRNPKAPAKRWDDLSEQEKERTRNHNMAKFALACAEMGVPLKGVEVLVIKK